MKNFELTVKIDENDLKMLREAGYKLCFAGKPMDADYNVVWYASSDYAVNNRIGVTDTYQIFASNSFVPKEKVFEDYSSVSAELGEQCRIDEWGILNHAVTGDNPDAVVLLNEYRPLYPGISRQGKGFRGETFTNPFFVSPNKILTGIYEFFPSFEIRLWFAQDLDTGFALPQKKNIYLRAASTNCLTIDLEKRGSSVLSYSCGRWKII